MKGRLLGHGDTRRTVGGVEPKGNPVTFELCAVFEFGEGENAGKLLCERCYFDNETLLRQMRGEADASTAVLGLAERSR